MSDSAQDVLPERFSLAREAVRDAVTLSSQPIPASLSSSPAWAAGFALWLRSIESAEATLLLVQNGMGGAAWSTLRTGCECLFYACGLWNKPEQFSRFQGAHHVERKKQISGLLDKDKNPDLSEENKAALESLMDNEANTRDWSAFDAASDAGLVQYYSLMYRGSSLAGAHGTARSLDLHFDVAADGTYSFKYEPNFNAAEMQTEWVLQMLAVGLDRLSNEIRSASPPSEARSPESPGHPRS